MSIAAAVLLAIVLQTTTPATIHRAVTLSFRRCYYFGSVLALAPVLLIGARSVGRGGWYELALVFAFEAIACFYVAKR